MHLSACFYSRRLKALVSAVLRVGIWVLIFPEPGLLMAQEFPVPRVPFAPRYYLCQRASGPIAVDGQLNEASWQKAAWTEDFVDIEGPLKPAPLFRTRAKMLWDDTYFYVAAELEEPHVWAKLTQRDTVIFYDNDFEVFIDPDGDTHLYYELEMNARNTVWDLLLVKPYRDGGPPVHGWDIRGLKTAVKVLGTLNQSADRDRGWTVEIAIPHAALRECARGAVPPRPGTRWRVNFSRVEWRTRIENGRYVKMVDPESGKPLPEMNWVWSPQGLINMHYPEMWGIVEFSDQPAGTRETRRKEFMHGERIRWMLRQVYYAQKQYWLDHGRFARRWEQLVLQPEPLDCNGRPELHTTPSGFEVTLDCPEDGRRWHIREDGRVWATPLPGR